MDREYYGTVAGQVGPLEARLEELAGGGGMKDLLGLCVGAFGYISTDLAYSSFYTLTISKMNSKILKRESLESRQRKEIKRRP